MLPGINYALKELKAVFQKPWEWRIGYALIGGFIIARWLGIFSSLELITLDFLLRNRLAEGKDEHVVVVLVDRSTLQSRETLSDQEIVRLLKVIFEADPAVVGLNIFRDKYSTDLGRKPLEQSFQAYDNLIGVQKILPPNEIPPIGNLSSEIINNQFGINDIPIDRDGRIRRVFIGAFSPTEVDESGNNIFRHSFSFKVAEKYLNSQGYVLDSLPSDPNTPVFVHKETKRLVKIPILSAMSGGYVRDNSIADVQALLNFRPGNDTFRIIKSEIVTSDQFNPDQLTGKAVIISGTDSFFPRFLPVAAKSNSIDEESQSQEILARLGIIGAELEAHSTSQIINAVLQGRPLITPIHYLLEDALIIVAGISGILVGNAFRRHQATVRNALLLAGGMALMLAVSYLLLCQFGIWIPVLPTTSLFAITGITYIAFYQSERLAIMQARTLEEERRKAIERTFNSIHAGPLQTLASLLRNVRDGKLDQDCLLTDLKSLNEEIRSIGEKLRQEAIEDVYFVDVRRDIKLDLNHPMHEVFYEIYNICLQKDLPGFKGLKVRSVAFEPFNCKALNLETKRNLCWFLQESLENVGKHAIGTTRLLVTGENIEQFYALRVEDNGPGLTSARVGEGTQLCYKIEETLRGKFTRSSRPNGGTLCEFTWSLHDMKAFSS